MVSESRSERIADRLNRELSMLFMQEISDPRLEGLSITGVEVDRELAYADVYVSALDGDGRKQDIMKALKKASGFIRAQLAGSVSHLRTFPEIRYHWDSVPDRVTRLDEIFAELEEEEGFKDLDE
ncbi:MAG: 30S ribosome-binding factor RbfA [Chloroflexota bacterium]|nr:MAG: 30S ribosome-binding factor RbfA [Chloroflexota bacterium]